MDTGRTSTTAIAAALAAILLTVSQCVRAAEIPTPSVAACNCSGSEKEEEMIAKLKADRRQSGGSSSEVVSRLLQLGNFYARSGDIEKSDERLKEALEVSSSVKPGKTQKFRADILIQQARNRITRQDFPAAERLLNEAAPSIQSVAQNAQLLALLGWSQAEQKRYEDSIANYEHSLVLQSKTPENDEKSVLMQQLASVYQKVGNQEKAAELLEAAALQTTKMKGERHPLTLFCQELLAAMLISQKQFARAERILAKVVSIKESVLGEDNPQIAGTLFQYAAALELVDRTKAARDVRFRANALTQKTSSK